MSAEPFSRHPVNPAHFVAYSGGSCIEQADTLPQLRDKLQALFCAGEREEVVCWGIALDGRARVALIVLEDGRILERDGHLRNQNWPKIPDAIVRRLLDRGPKPA